MTVLERVDSWISPLNKNKRKYLWRPILLVCIAIFYVYLFVNGLFDTFPARVDTVYKESFKNILPFLLAAPFAYLLWLWRNHDKQIELTQKDEELKQKSEEIRQKNEEWEHVRRVDHQNILKKQFELMINGKSEAGQGDAASEIKLYLEGFFGEEHQNRGIMMFCNYLNSLFHPYLERAKERLDNRNDIYYDLLYEEISQFSGPSIEGVDHSKFSWVSILSLDQFSHEVQKLLLANNNYSLTMQSLKNITFDKELWSGGNFFRLEKGQVLASASFWGVYFCDSEISINNISINFKACTFSYCKINISSQGFGINFNNCIFEFCTFHIHESLTQEILTQFFDRCIFSKDIIADRFGTNNHYDIDAKLIGNLSFIY